MGEEMKTDLSIKKVITNVTDFHNWMEGNREAETLERVQIKPNAFTLKNVGTGEKVLVIDETRPKQELLKEDFTSRLQILKNYIFTIEAVLDKNEPDLLNKNVLKDIVYALDVSMGALSALENTIEIASGQKK